MNTPIAPPQDVLEAFTITGEPVLLKGGQGQTWRAGDVVLKPTQNIEETAWCAELINTLPQNQFRTARHKKSKYNEWVHNNWAVLEFIEGHHIVSHWEEKITVCRGFNELLVDIPKPDFIDARTDPWAIAGKMTWDELPMRADKRLTSYIETVTKHLQPLTKQSQIVHGDITGNMLFADHLPPGIIDFTPTWRPKEYALAILIVDAITWEGADETIFSYIEHEKNMFQFLLRAALFRTLVTSEFYRQLGVDRFSELPKHESILAVILGNQKRLS